VNFEEMSILELIEEADRVASVPLSAWVVPSERDSILAEIEAEIHRR